MINVNKLVKNILLGGVAAFMVACSSDAKNDFVETEDGGVWRKVSLSTRVDEGQNDAGSVATRAEGELDAVTGLPSVHYPDKLGLYIHKYNGEGMEPETIVLRNENVQNDNIDDFVYKLNREENRIYLKKDKDSDSGISLLIEESFMTNKPKESFAFTSREEASEVVDFPSLPVEDNLYPEEYKNATMEYGDRLFATGHYFFAWDEKKEKVNLYFIKQNDDQGTVVPGDIKEVEDWNVRPWSIIMNRLTSCFSVRLIIVDSFQNGKPKSIEGMDEVDEAHVSTGIAITNKALGNYIKANQLDIPNFGVENVFVRKKILDNFPSQLDYSEGLITRARRKPLYLCNLDYPAWINNVTSYEHGNAPLSGLTSICDSEPFVPTSSPQGGIPRIEIHLFVGIGERDLSVEHPDADHPGGTYSKAVILKVPVDNYGVAPNLLHSYYIIFTLKNLTQLYEKLNPPSTRNSDVEEMIIPEEQVVMTSEPLRFN